MAKPRQIKPVSDSKHIFMGVYGEPGIGKSRLLGTSPGKVLVIRPPVDHLDSLLPADKARVEQWIIHDWAEMNAAEEYLREVKEDEWDWVWVDSWSLLQDVLLDDVFGDAVERKPERAKFWADQGEYGVNMGRIGAWMRHVVGPDLFNFGFTGHTAVLPSPDLDEDGDPVEKLMPWIQGRNMSPKLCGYTNLLCFMERAGKQGRRVLRSQADPRYYAKDQFDAFKDGILWDPTMPKVVDLIEKSPGRNSGPGSKSTAAPRRRVARPRVRR
jgi:hypothetical protein